jgi:predicted anti-sigma-YlaC factor YlaD
MWLKNDLPPHMIGIVDFPPQHATLERLVKAHLELCPECQEWSEARDDPAYDRWLFKKYLR